MEAAALRDPDVATPTPRIVTLHLVTSRRHPVCIDRCHPAECSLDYNDIDDETEAALLLLADGREGLSIIVESSGSEHEGQGSYCAIL